jgi:hypothetical protein
VANSNDARIIRLEREHPGWHVWVVYRAVGGAVWCARRHDDHDAENTLNAASAEELAERIGGQSREDT